MVRHILALVCFLLSFSLASSAQDKVAEAKEKGKKGVALADEGKLDEAIVLLTEAQKLDPATMKYMYELGYCYTAKKDYAKAIKCFNDVLHHKDADALNYQMLGNAYDDMGDTLNALKTYKDGLAKFPKAGGLWLETGNYYFARDNYSKALTNYEEGMKRDPEHPSNYFRATQIFLTMSEEEIWGMLYGEIFINLEPATQRTKVVSKWLYDKYKSEIKWENDTSGSVSFSKSSTMDPKNPKLPLSFIYEGGHAAVMVGTAVIDLEGMCDIRTKFIKYFFDNNFYKDYPIAIFDYNYKIMKAGHLDAYNHWLLSQGDTKGYAKWMSTHKADFDRFAEWYKTNKLVLDEKKVLVRKNYGG